MSKPTHPVPEAAMDLKLEGDALFAKGKFDEAKAKYGEALVIAPSCAVLLSNRSMCNRKTAHFADALEDAAAAAAADATWYRPQARMARALMQMGRWTEAVAALEASVALWEAGGAGSVPADLTADLAMAKAKVAAGADAEADAVALREVSSFVASVERGEADAVAAYVARGGDVNAAVAASLDVSGPTPLIVAVKAGAAAVANVLLDAGAAVNGVDVHGRSALWYAAEVDSPILAALLLRAGADKHLADNAGVSPDTVARENLAESSFSEVVVLFDEPEPESIPLPDLVPRFISSEKAPPPEWNGSTWFGVAGVTVLATVGILAYVFLRRRR